MPYQGVSGTPRFYIDILTYLLNTELGYWAGKVPKEFANYAGVSYNSDDIVIEDEHSLLGLNPALRTKITPLREDMQSFDFSIGFYEQLSAWFDHQNKNNFMAILGHNLASRDNNNGLDMFVHSWVEEYEEIINSDIVSLETEGSLYTDGTRPYYDNASIFKFRHTNIDVVYGDLLDPSWIEEEWFGQRVMPSFAVNLKFKARDSVFVGLDPLYIGAIACGTFYDMPHSPEFSLKMSHDYKGSKKSRGVRGGDYSNSNWGSPPKWGNLSSWEMPSPHGAWFDGMLDFTWKYSGRRVWNLEFNQIQDVDIEPFNLSGIGPDYAGGHSSNWLQNVMRMTMGGALPFIFCPDPQVKWFDGNASQLDPASSVPPRGPQFAICRFDMKSFEKEQVANGVYNFKIKIKETW